MKKYIIILVGILAGCSTGNRRNIELTTLNASIILPSTAFIEYAPASDFGEPRKVSISSLDPSDINEVAAAQKNDTYFNFSIYEGVPWNKNSKEIIQTFCLNKDAGIAQEYVNAAESYQLLSLSNDCFAMHKFVLIHNKKLYEIRAGQDAMNYDALWQALKTLRIND